MHTHTHTHTHTHAHTLSHTHAHTCTHAHMNACIQVLLLIVFSSASIAYCLLLLLAIDKLTPKLLQLSSLLMLAMWLVAAGIGTFRAPFLSASNGFFGLWGGLVGCAYAAHPHLPSSLQVTSARMSSTGQASQTPVAVGLTAQYPPPPGPPPNAPPTLVPGTVVIEEP